MAAKRRCHGNHWCIFGDDTGDPGVATGASPHFGYAVFGFELARLPEFVEHRARLRIARSKFDEMKPSAGPLFAALTDHLSEFTVSGATVAAACMISKDHYEGPYLREWNGKPRNPTWLRQYILRHALELAFAGDAIAPEDHIDLVLDRDTWMDQGRLDNLRDYLNSKFAQHGGFALPKVEHVTAVDSRWAEGVQAADHLSRLAKLASIGNLPKPHFGTIATILRSRDFEVPPELHERLHNDGRTTERRRVAPP